MALTENASWQGDIQAPNPAPRRSVVSRLSMGHIVMLLAGLVAILLNLALLRSTSHTVAVVVAGADLPAGAVLDADGIATVDVGDIGDLAGGLVTDAGRDGLLGSVLARDLRAGEPLRRSDLRPAGTFLGRREYSIAVPPAGAAGGSIRESDVVDIIGVADGEASYVATGIEVVRVTGDDRALDRKLILVLSVDDQDALAIESAQANGTISVVRATGAESIPVDR